MTGRSDRRRRRSQASYHRDRIVRAGRDGECLRIGQPAAWLEFTAEVFELWSGEPSFQKAARVHARRRVPLEVDLITSARRLGPAEEVILAHLVERGG